MAGDASSFVAAGAQPTAETASSPYGDPRLSSKATAARRLLPRLLRAELLRGIAPLAAAVALVAVLGTMAGQKIPWQSRWTDAAMMLRTASLLVGGPIAAAAGCWQGGREHRRGTVELRASYPRGVLRQTLLAAAPAVVWPVVAYGVAAAAALLSAWPYTGEGHPLWSLLVSDAAALGMLGAVGFAVGRLVVWPLAAPVVGAVTYVLLAAPDYTDSGPTELDPAHQTIISYEVPVWWFVPAIAVWCAGLGAAALLAVGTSAWRRSLRPLPALAALAVAVAAAVPIARTGDNVWRADPAATREVCSAAGPGPRICLPAADSELLGPTTAAFAHADALLRGEPGAPGRWVAEGLPLRRGDARLEQPDGLMMRGRLTNPALYAHGTVTDFLVGDCPMPDPSAPDLPRADAINSAVARWLAPEDTGIVDHASDAELRRLRALSPTSAHAFLGRYLRANRCDPAEVPVP